MNGHGPGIPRRPSPGWRAFPEPDIHAGRYRNRCIFEDPHMVFEALSEFEPGFPMTVGVQKEIRKELEIFIP